MAKKKKGNWLGIVITGVAVLVYVYFSEENSRNNGGINQPTVVDNFEKPKLNSYGLNAVRDDWPKLAEASVEDQQDKLRKNYYVILDDSGSMKSDICATGHESRLHAAIDALSAFANGLPQQANLGVMSFDGGRYTELLPIGKQSPEAIDGLAQRMNVGGRTPLASAMTRGYEALTRQAELQLGYGEYHLVVITDGEATSGEYPDKIINKILTESPVDVHTIGFCIGKHHVLNQPNYLSYQAADNVQALRQGLQDVLAESPTFTVSSFE